MSKRIAIVEDETELASLIEYNLIRSGYDAQVLGGSAGTLRALEQSKPDLILLDVMLPDVDGFELCRQIRQSATLGRTPVLFLTARSDEVDRVLGLEIGGDDYMTKPFSPRELVARVDAVLRRSEEMGTNIIRFGRVEIDCAAMILRINSLEVPTTTLEFRLLEYLARSPGLVFSRDRLLEAVWGNSKFVSRRSVDVYVSKLREKIETDPNNPEYLLTVRGAGYKMMLPKGAAQSRSIA